MKDKLSNTEWQNLLNYFNNDELAAKVWVEKYALRSSKGDLLENLPEEMHHRMAKEFYRIEEHYNSSSCESEKLSDYGQTRLALTYDSIFEYFKDFKYLVPQGSVMSNLGDSSKFTSLSNCVVVPEIFDSYGGIFFSDQQLAQLYKRRCGVGIDISNLRPIYNKVQNSARTTSGAVSFMDRFSNTTREVAQHGRRGALMITIDVRHPEIIQFVNAKNDLTKVTGANISVRLTNDFMRAVREDKAFELKWPVESSNPSIIKEVRARDIWIEIINSAHANAEPGVLFWDQQHFYSTSSIYPQFRNTSTNPCSEIAMQGGDSCRLMAINLFSFVENPFSENSVFNFKKLYEVAYEGMRLMDDLVDLELEHIERIINKIKLDKEPQYIKDVELKTWELLKNNGKEGRRTGLGFTGLADSLAAIGLKYDSQQALLQIDSIMRTKFQGEIDSTIDLSIQRGSFKGFSSDIEKLSDFVSKMMYLEFPEAWERMQEYGRRNVSFSTVAPTGTLSLLTQTSSGIEPVYMLSYKRRKKVNSPTKKSVTDNLGDHWEEYQVYHPKLDLWSKVTGNKDFEKSPYWGSEAKEINWEKRIAIQKVIQKYTTHSISSTVNLPSNVSKSQVSNIYIRAWEEGLKGITVYRDGSRDGVLLSNDIHQSERLKVRPDVIESEVVRFKNENEEWIAVVGLIHEKPFEIFTGKIDKDFLVPDGVKRGVTIKVKGKDGNRYDFQFSDKSGKTRTLKGLSRAFNIEYWNYAKLISGMLRIQMPIDQIVKLVEGLNLYEDSINTWKNGVSRALRSYINPGFVKKGSFCPSCYKKDSLEYQEGCLKCNNCGFTECK